MLETLAIRTQHSPNRRRVGDNPSAARPHFRLSVTAALSETNLLERVREFRYSSLEIKAVNSDLSIHALSNRAQSMLQLKRASEQFNDLLTPVDVVHRRVLQELELEQLLSVAFWRGLFLFNIEPGQGKSELDSLCSKLSNAKEVLTEPGIENTISTIRYNRRSGKAYAGMSSDTSMISPTSPAATADAAEAAATADAADAADAAVKESTNFSTTARQTLRQTQSIGAAQSGFITGVSALLLIMLALNAFAPDIKQLLAAVPIGSTPYRLVMLMVLLTLTTSFFLMVSSCITAKSLDGVSLASANSDDRFLTRLFDFGASPRRVFAGALGPVFLGLGQGISVSAGFGTFGLAVLLDGIDKTFHVPLWLSQTVITIACYVLAWLWARVPIGLGTLTTLLLIGPAINLGAQITPDGLSFAGNAVAFLLGLCLFAVGISLAASAALGPDGVTALSIAAERVHFWTVPAATFLWDITAITAGIILGGNFGIATVVALLTVPLLIHLFIPPLRRVLH